jgi:hypothetical protein
MFDFIEEDVQQQQVQNDDITHETQVLRENLESQLGNKIKVSFSPNQYYNEKIYSLENYLIVEDEDSITLNLNIKDGQATINYLVRDVVKLESQPFFNRIEYKAYKSQFEAYNFCLYF